ncbi:LysM peptidoglycan-binding domain-containing protein [Nocardioides litoris]|uniref:LysM peptidoglycan-binding domain-containing protein n=1 Tax=Nocardioides litoris TaxID=1926648 RepID=UPI00111D14BA|nr:LysM domain-containing protein [Nocardioides litoris]
MTTTMRCLLVWAVATLVAGTVAAWAVAPAREGAARAFDDAVVAGAGWVLAACALWAWVVCTVVVVQAVRRAPAPSLPGVPAWAVRGLLAACGVAALTTAPAHATSVDLGPAGTGVAAATAGRSATSTADLDGLPFPDRAVGPAHARRAPVSEVVVRPGDSLWAISEGLLGPEAAVADVAHATDDLYRANHVAVGDDPDLIHPGLRLRTPDHLQHPKES